MLALVLAFMAPHSASYTMSTGPQRSSATRELEAGRSSRRTLLGSSAATLAVALTGARPSWAIGDVDRFQTFDKGECVKRNLLGKCDVYGAQEEGAQQEPDAPVIGNKQKELLQKMEAEQDANALIAQLRQKSAENKEKNMAEVDLRSFENGQAGEFGPFSRFVPIRKLDGSYEILDYPTMERLKKQKLIVNKKFTVEDWRKEYKPEPYKMFGLIPVPGSELPLDGSP